MNKYKTWDEKKKRIVRKEMPSSFKKAVRKKSLKNVNNFL